MCVGLWLIYDWNNYIQNIPSDIIFLKLQFKLSESLYNVVASGNAEVVEDDFGCKLTEVNALASVAVDDKVVNCSLEDG